MSVPGIALRGVLAACLVAAGAASATCPPPGHDMAQLQALKATDFELQQGGDREALAFGLVACLGDPDPAIRDGIAYEALAHWLRADAFDVDVLRRLRDRLQALLVEPDPDGFRQPFAALVLSEVARTDRIRAWMSPGERLAMVRAAAAWVSGVRDYRGFDPRAGWRHGVAHGADWLMQLALNPALDRIQADAIIAAVAAQAMPASGHAYVFGEPERLARPLLFVAGHGFHDDDEWAAWLSARRADLGPPHYGDIAWLARRHDLMALLRVLYVEASQSEDPDIARLQPLLAQALRELS